MYTNSEFYVSEVATRHFSLTHSKIEKSFFILLIEFKFVFSIKLISNEL